MTVPRIAYIDRKFSDASLDTIREANRICREYARQGFDLTLRQLYYQFVSRGLIANKDAEYKRLGSIINDARLAGLIDWDYIVDRTRNLRSVSHWADPADIVKSAAHSFRVDKWDRQEYRPEVWIEKDALIGVIAGVCERNDVPYLSCRGYTSQSEVWGAAQRLRRYLDNGQVPVILHLGDHDPSGIDMTRDITSRLALFTKSAVAVDRLALNFPQVEQYDPPPNPAKLTDSRSTTYVELHGMSSWELDALEPTVIAALIEEAIGAVRDDGLWQEAVEEETEQRGVLERAAAQWGEVKRFLDGAA